MEENNVTVLEDGVFDKIKSELTFENRDSGKITSASNTIPLGDYGEAEAEFILIKNDGKFVYLVNLDNQSIAIHSNLRIDDNNLSEVFRNAFLSKSIDDAEKIYVLGYIDLKEKNPVKTGFLQIIGVEAKDLSGISSIYPLDTMSMTYNIYRDDVFKASQKDIENIKNSKFTELTKAEYLDLVKSIENYSNKIIPISTRFDDPVF